MSEDRFDVYDTVDDVIVSVVKKKFSPFSRAERNEFCCTDCLIKIERQNKTKIMSCCGGGKSFDWTTVYRDAWLLHLQEHERRGDEVPEDAWTLELK